MVYSMKSFKQGLNNLFSPTIINLLVMLCLIIIVGITYLQTNKIELFEGSYINSFINRYIQKYANKSAQQKILDSQEQRIQTLSQQVSDTINPTKNISTTTRQNTTTTTTTTIPS